jgi:hypothetical protein
LISTIVALNKRACAPVPAFAEDLDLFFSFFSFFVPFRRFSVSVSLFLSFPVSPVNYKEAGVCLVGADDTGGEELPKPLSALPDVVPGGRELERTWAMC